MFPEKYFNMLPQQGLNDASLLLLTIPKLENQESTSCPTLNLTLMQNQPDSDGILQQIDSPPVLQKHPSGDSPRPPSASSLLHRDDHLGSRQYSSSGSPVLSDFHSLRFSGPLHLIQGQIESEYMPDCPTSNCTWEPFDTLAVCSSCVDAMSSLQSGCHIVVGDWLTDVTVIDPDDRPPNVTSCGWFFTPPNGSPQLMTGYSIDNQSRPQTGLVIRLYPLTDVIMEKPVVPRVL
jgi:hypothetical protein